MAKTLVAYFSVLGETGITGRAAAAIAEAAGADLFEIVPAQAYTKADVDYTDPRSRSCRENDDESARPEVASHVADMDGYDVVFVGCPIWWGVEPRIVDSFLDAHDFSDKVIVPFATSGGSGIGAYERHLQKVCPAATIRQGRLLNGRQTADSVRPWVKSSLA